MVCIQVNVISALCLVLTLYFLEGGGGWMVGVNGCLGDTVMGSKCLVILSLLRQFALFVCLLFCHNHYCHYLIVSSFLFFGSATALRSSVNSCSNGSVLCLSPCIFRSVVYPLF